MSSKTIFSLVMLAAIALLSGWLLIEVESSLREDNQENLQVPPLFMDNFSVIRMNLQGIREYTLTASYLVQLPGDQGTRIEQPKLEMFQDEKTLEWLLQANQGWISPDHTLIRLENGVTLTRPSSSGKRPVIVTTRRLSISPDEELVETTEPVHAEIPGGVADAIGLRARLDEEQLELLSNVRGSYAAPNL